MKLTAFPVAFQVHAEVSLPGAIIFFFLSSVSHSPLHSSREVFCKSLFIKFPFLDLILYSVSKMVFRTPGNGIAVFKSSLTLCQWWQQHVISVLPLPSLTETHISVVRDVPQVSGSSRGGAAASLRWKVSGKSKITVAVLQYWAHTSSSPSVAALKEELLSH